MAPTQPSEPTRPDTRMQPIPETAPIAERTDQRADAQLWAAYCEQQRRRLCPGCGETTELML